MSESNQEEQVRELLAAIEHERWASWQIWCNRVIREAVPNNPTLETILKRWDRQINLPYQLLSDKEKASDMEQVDRYWPLIQKYVEQAETAARIRQLEHLLEQQEAMIIHGAVFVEMKQKWVVRVKVIEDLLKELKGVSNESR